MYDGRVGLVQASSIVQESTSFMLLQKVLEISTSPRGILLLGILFFKRWFHHFGCHCRTSRRGCSPRRNGFQHRRRRQGKQECSVTEKRIRSPSTREIVDSGTLRIAKRYEASTGEKDRSIKAHNLLKLDPSL